MNQLDHVKVVSHVPAQVAGSTNFNAAAGIDMSGYDGVMFILQLGTLTAGQVTKLQVQGSSDNAVWAAFTADLVSASAADGDSGKMIILDVFQPQKRYVRATVQRGTQNAVINSVVAILYRALKKPVVQAAGDVSQSISFVGAA